jgi:hypothetical protein
MSVQVLAIGGGFGVARLWMAEGRRGVGVGESDSGIETISNVWEVLMDCRRELKR